ncbi:hypothetical protein E4U43_008353 [Claviceps pusilla]|uniref:SH3 domain-containing protein n=1 Tax=Claviceps pusilla TaxID=123648 RepID=A0A9P7ND81_9HYPO|nr:hypothetical protein E4U43_008353 [Claviceps pusilla]
MLHPHRHHHDVARGIIDKMEEILHKPFAEKRASHENEENESEDGGSEAVIIHTVYKTLSPTFSGPVAGYSTLLEGPAPEATPATEPTHIQAVTPIAKAATKTSGQSPSPSSSSPVPTAIRRPLTASGLDTILAEATGKPKSPSMDLGVPTAILGTVPTDTSTSQSSTPQDSSNETSVGTKAGIAFGVLGGVLVVGLIAYLLFSHRRRQALNARLSADNEKYPSNGRPFETMTIRSDPHAPRISLRPVTQFLPAWGLDKRASKGAGAAPAPPAAPIKSNGQNNTQNNPQNSAQNSAQVNGMRDRSATSQSTHVGNPFGSQAERVLEPTIPEHGKLPPSDPFTAAGPAIATDAGTAGALARKTSMRNGGPRPLDLTLAPATAPIPASPADTEFSMTSLSPSSAVSQSKGAAAIAAAGGPHNSNVHRVQLDFKPSLEDEMEMKAGELVRLLHEYDDGWALCIRLDRSQQGVVPRTCLSTRPVKPRSPEGGPRPGPPVNPSGQFPRGLPGRPMTPQGRSMTSQSMPQVRPMTSQGLPQGRPMTPQNVPQGPPRTGLSGTASRPISPLGPSQSPGPRCNEPSPEVPASRPKTPMGSATRRLDHVPGAPPTNQAGSPPSGPPSTLPPEPIVRKPIPGQAY